ncbi:UDP-N-acetylmuramate--L-alanine ligase [Veillonella sp. R32]|uniref:UDP-N-acetylmuramate--L-alanine ligase n=1 Tax=Veillonella sp. R32 TaxID=2021312 RepID=UPI0013898824|nr:UDP-N-acetylmuramate--L-alanine ligase [Veillonella sp. R32]KAF1682858.1 UDP-N-acetylmuramate--L-alanine ligase [Veillonella sp. R32]
MLDGIHKIHLIGIAGSGMRAIANILISQGFDVSGSDIQESAVTERFRKMGATIHIGHNAAYVKGVDAVVRSTAIHADNPELMAAEAQHIPILHRSDIVKAVLDITKGIAVAGAHGKTTTTSMLGQIFVEAGLDPTVIIGGEVDYLGGSSQWGRGEYSIAEADESDGSFLKLNPHEIVITNIENDHMDHYGTMENLLTAFAEFVGKLPAQGTAVVCGDNENIQHIMKQVDRQFITYGLTAHNEYTAQNIHYEKGVLVYDAFHQENCIATVRLKVPGTHNALNSLGALVMATRCGIPVEVVVKGLAKFTGAKRRFETKGHSHDVWVVDDYAHHPTEIAATLGAAKALESHRVVCIFQPHRFTRTNLLLKEFGQAFKKADVLFITDIYSAGEEPIAGIDGHSIPNMVEATTGQTVHYIPHVEDVPKVVKAVLQPNDLVITMGAGSISQYGPKLLAALEEE